MWIGRRGSLFWDGFAFFHRVPNPLLAGTAPPPHDVFTDPESNLSLAENQVVTDLLVAADFLQQFAKQLELPFKPSQVWDLTCVSFRCGI